MAKNGEKWLMSLFSLSSVCFLLIKFQGQKPLPAFHVIPCTLVPQQVPQFQCHPWDSSARAAHQPGVCAGSRAERRGSVLGSSPGCFQVSLFNDRVSLLWRVTPVPVCALRAAPSCWRGRGCSSVPERLQHPPAAGSAWLETDN